MSWEQPAQMIFTQEPSVYEEDPYIFQESSAGTNGKSVVQNCVGPDYAPKAKCSKASDDNNNSTTASSYPCLSDNITDASFLARFFNNPNQQPSTIFSAQNGITSATQTATVTATVTPKLSASVTTSLRLSGGRGSQSKSKQQLNRRSSNVCVVRPQLQQKGKTKAYQKQQQQKTLSSKESLKIIDAIEEVSTFTHTPSLWQTPLILAKAPAITVPNAIPPIPLPPSPVTPTALSNTPQLQFQPSLPPETTTTAMVAPTFVAHSIIGAAQTLPPSKFSVTTIAQHMELAQTLKQPKKATATRATSTQGKSEKVLIAPFPPKPTQHSSVDGDDPNEIPVNVIYRQQQHQLPEKNSCTSRIPGIQGYQFQIVTNTPTSISAKSTTSMPINNFVLPAHQQQLIEHTSKLSQTPNTSHLLNQLFTPLQASSQQQNDHQKSSLNVANTKNKMLTNNKNQRESDLQSPTVGITSKILQPKNENIQIEGLKGGKPSCKTLPNKTNRSKRKKNEERISNKNREKSVSSKKAGRKADTYDSDDCSTENVEDYIKTTNPLKTCPIIHSYLNPEQHYKVNSLGCSKLSLREQRERLIAEQKLHLFRQLNNYECMAPVYKHSIKKFEHNIFAIERLYAKSERVSPKKFPAKKCTWENCPCPKLELSQYCVQHFTTNTNQTLFVPCSAKRKDGTLCNIPVFDVIHELDLCPEHRALQNYIDEQEYKQLHLPATPTPKPLLETLPELLHTDAAMTHQLPSATNTPSLESITSNSQSSAYSNTQQNQEQHQQRGTLLTSYNNSTLSTNITDINYANPMMNQSKQQSEEMCRILAQLTSGYSENSAQCSNTTYLSNTGGGVGDEHFFNILDLTADPNADDMLSLNEFPLKGLFGIDGDAGENGSLYDNSQDTGFCGLSETEPLLGSQAADDIPLGDTVLDQDFHNILLNEPLLNEALPIENFNELFATVPPDERDQVERALELVDENLKTLQQSIGNDQDLFGSLLNSNHMEAL